MSKKLSEMGGVELWREAHLALGQGRLRDAKNALDELGLRFDDSYSRLEAEMAKLAPDAESKVWS